jgi:hypothetical protein
MGRLHGIFHQIGVRLGLTGDRTRIKHDASDVPLVAVALHRPEHWCATHAGMAYRSRGSLRVLHLGAHEWLNDEPANDADWLYAVPSVAVEDGEYLAGLCRRIIRAHAAGKIPYAFEFEADSRFDPNSGKYVGPPGSGLSCSTFVAAVFRAAGVPLILLPTWPAEASKADIKVRDWMLDMWAKSGRPNLVQRAAEIRPSIQARRVSPQEVAGSCLRRRLPAAYKRCRADGEVVLQAAHKRFGPPPPPPP